MPHLKPAQARAPSSRFIAAVTATAIALAVAAILVLAAGRQHQIDVNEQSSDLAPTSEPTPSDYRVSFLGDGATVGVGAPAGTGYASIMAWQGCWNQNINGQTGTGYLAQGDPVAHYSSYLSRVRDVGASRPELIIVQGGESDPLDGLTEAAETLYRTIRTQIPAATLVVIGPLGGPDGQRSALSTRAIRQAAKNAQITFYDPVERHWLEKRSYYDPSGTGLNEEGYRVLGRALFKQLTDDNLLPERGKCKQG